jgi:poly-gamma-glutamate synthesis protein (capsule biosynthesis protein)
VTERDTEVAADAVGWRGRLQRRLRRERAVAARHAVIGAVVSAALVLVPAGTVDLAPAPAGATNQQTDAASVPDDEVVFSAVMVGDVMFARHVERVVERRGYDALLEHVAHELDGDYVSGNLEQVISDDDDLPEADKLIHLVSGAGALEAMVDAGFTTLSLANNHIMDHGIPGLRDTIAALDEAGLAHAGAGEDLEAAVRIDYQELAGLTVATLSFTDVFVEGFIARAFQGGALQAEPEVMIPLLQQADANADLVIAHVHFGEEYDLRVTARQREIAEVVAAAGADILVGHHPHVLLPAETIGDTLVLYSLGNFVFDQGWSRTRESAIARYELLADGTARVSFLPIYIREATPRPLEGPLATYRRERIFQRLRGDTLPWQREDGRLVTELDHGHVLADLVADDDG